MEWTRIYLGVSQTHNVVYPVVPWAPTEFYNKK